MISFREVYSSMTHRQLLLYSCYQTTNRSTVEQSSNEAIKTEESICTDETKKKANKWKHWIETQQLTMNL